MSPHHRAKYIRRVASDGCDHDLPEHLSGGCPICIAGQLALAQEKIQALESKIDSLIEELDTRPVETREPRSSDEDGET